MKLTDVGNSPATASLKLVAGSSVKNTIDDIITNGDNLGLKTETAVRDILESQNYTWIDAKYGSNNGYDGLFIKGTNENPTEIIIVESKQFKYSNNKAGDLIEHSGVSLSPPSTTTPLPAQMSDEWVRYVARKLDKAGKTDIADMVLDNPGLIKKYVSAVDKVEGEINFLKLGNY
ncbi:MAG: hypothetical protein ABJN84_00845 [Flavobacteriaceae bacterium]